MKINWAIVVFGIGLAILIVFRAINIPITHDEAGTWFHAMPRNQWKCFFDPACWANANNHWLNTLLMQFCAKLGGEGQFVLRIPNVLAGFGYIIAAYLLSKRYLEHYASQVAAFLWLCLHLYLLDFFSLARGYGLMSCGVLWSIYGALRYIERFEFKWLLVCLGALVFAVLSNFTALTAYVAVLGIVFAWMFIHQRSRLLNPLLLTTLISACLFLLIRLPLRWLSSGGEFEWGASHLKQTGMDLMVNLIGAGRYGWLNGGLLLCVLLFLFLIGLIFALVKIKIKSTHPVLLSLLMFLAVLGVIFSLQRILGALPPIGRKSIMLIPFFFGALGLCQRFIASKRTATITGILGSAVILFHFFHTLHPVMKSSREWYYDAYYPELFSTLVPQKEKSDSVSVGASWIFIPGLIYYQKTDSLPISGLQYHKELLIDSNMQYYFIDPSDLPRMDTSRYQQEKMVGPFYLFKRK